MIVKFLSKFFESNRDREYKYLSDSVDLIDLERRMKEIEKGIAPFQRPYHSYQF